VTEGPVLQTERLILRPPVETDLDDWAAFVADEAAMRYLGGAKGRSEAWRIMAVVAGSWVLRGYGMFSVIERESGRWIGRVGPWQPEGWPGTEVGWGLRPDAWGRGHATEAARAAIDWAFDTLGWTEVVHVIAPENLPSAAVAARLGSVNRGPGRLPVPLDGKRVDIWGQSAASWRAGRGV
jgi:RimJ/RimL family protein N-acetyltransferase